MREFWSGQRGRRTMGNSSLEQNQLKKAGREVSRKRAFIVCEGRGSGGVHKIIIQRQRDVGMEVMGRGGQRGSD